MQAHCQYFHPITTLDNFFKIKIGLALSWFCDEWKEPLASRPTGLEVEFTSQTSILTYIDT